MNHFDLLEKLVQIEKECDLTQRMIDRGREMFAKNRVMQLELDRRQTELDEKRELLKLTRIVVPQNN